MHPIRFGTAIESGPVTATEEARELALIAADAASGKLATDIVLIDVSERLAITDIFVIASGSNERQVEAIVDEVEEKLRAAGRKPLRREGRRDGRWVLLDYADIVIHIQHTEERVFYALERLWKDCPMISVDARGGGSTDWVQPGANRSAGSTPDAFGPADGEGPYSDERSGGSGADELSAELSPGDFSASDLSAADLPGDDLPADDLPADDLSAADLPGDDLPGGDLAAARIGSQ